MAWGPTAPLWSVRPAHPETWSLAQAMAILTLPKVQGPSVLSFFLSPHNRPVFVVCALWINLRDRCCNSLSSCCYSLVKRLPSHHHVQGGGNSPRVHSSYTGEILCIGLPVRHHLHPPQRTRWSLKGRTLHISQPRKSPALMAQI